MRIVVRFGDHPAAGVLDDTAAARRFAQLLPLEIELRDPMGQAKSGPLGRQLDVAGSDRITDPTVGEIGYWEPSKTLAVFYDDLGQTLPAPGLVRLGVLDLKTVDLASAGNRVRVRFELVDSVVGLSQAVR